MKSIGNIIWFVFGGFIIFLLYILASFLLFFTIIGIPFALQTIKLAGLALWPFGAEVKDSENEEELASFFLNLFWIFFGGFWIALSHLVFSLLFAITIIGIPFAMQHLKMANLALFPFGKIIVPKQ